MEHCFKLLHFGHTNETSERIFLVLIPHVLSGDGIIIAYTRIGQTWTLHELMKILKVLNLDFVLLDFVYLLC